MSLYLGNLPPHIRRDDLEGVFRRFGRCGIQLMGRYGFAVYDIPAHAERAIQLLRGKKICGERITIAWSNEQPRPVRGFRSGGRTYELHRRRSSAREDYSNRRLGSGSQREYRMSANRRDADGRSFESVDRGDEVTRCREKNIEDDVGEVDPKVTDKLAEEGKTFETNLLHSGRLSEQVDHLSKDNGVENGLQFEQNEHNHADGRKDEEADIYHNNCSGGSPDPKKYQEKRGTDQADDTILNDTETVKSKHTCYTCGNLGHIMHNCPVGKASDEKEERSRADRRRDDKFNYKGKGEASFRKRRFKSQGRLQPGRDSSPLRKRRTFIRREHSPSARGTNRHRREEHRGRKRKQREKGSPTRHQKKAREQEPSPVHSASRSGSHLKSASGFSPKSRLQSEYSKLGSQSSSATTDSTSHSSRFEKSMVNLKARSASPTLSSLHVSPIRTPSSQTKVQIVQNVSFMNSESPESKGVLGESGRLLEVDAGTCNYNLDARIVTGNQSAEAPYKMDEDEDMNRRLFDKKDDYHATVGDTLEVDDSCAPGLKEGNLTAGSLSTQALRDVMEVENCYVSVDQDHDSISTKNLHSVVPMSSHSSTIITPEEIYNALKHYGMERSQEHVKDSTVEDLFGSARLWPWEIIYYRRLKKGPVSVENYARRVSQNNEFGIVDKFVRSSSGWNELRQDSS